MTKTRLANSKPKNKPKGALKRGPREKIERLALTTTYQVYRLHRLKRFPGKLFVYLINESDLSYLRLTEERQDHVFRLLKEFSSARGSNFILETKELRGRRFKIAVSQYTNYKGLSFETLDKVFEVTFENE